MSSIRPFPFKWGKVKQEREYEEPELPSSNKQYRIQNVQQSVVSEPEPHQFRGDTNVR